MNERDDRRALSVGFYMPMSAALSNPASGVLRLARELRQHLGASEAVRVSGLDPWDPARTSGLDIVHAFGYDPGIVDLLPQRPFASVVHTFQDPLTPAWKYRIAIKAGLLHPRFDTIPGEKARLYRAVDMVVSMSDNERRRIAKSFGIPAARIGVVHCGVNPPVDVPETRRLEVVDRLCLPPRFALALCDYGSPRKNILALVRALEPTEIPLVLAGHATEGGYLNQIRAVADRAANITLRGPVDESDIPALYSSCAIYCQPSLFEGAGLSAMQAATYGANVVAAPVGGAPEHLGPAAYYAPPADIAAIRDAAVAAWESPRTGTVGRFVLEERSWNSSVIEMISIYRHANVLRRARMA